MTTLVQPKSQVLTMNGLRLHYLDWDNGGAPPMICVHGYTSSAQAFNALARHVQDRFQIIAPDGRGHGESAWSPAGAYAGAHPERLVRLVINDIGPDAEVGSQRITQMVGGRPEAFATLEDALAYRRQISPIVASRSEEDQRELALGVLRQRPDRRWVWKMDPVYIQQWVQHGAPPRPALWPALHRLPCPTLVVWGMDSDVLSEAQARRMVEVLPRGELVAVPDVGHAPTLIEPVSLAALERFLGGRQ
jgi:esterase